MQIYLPQSSNGNLDDLLEGRQILGRWRDTDADQVVLHLLVPAEETEPIMDRFEQRFSAVEGFHVILFPVEAVLPRPVAKPKEEESPAADEEKEKERQRISREELYNEVAESLGISRVYLGMIVLSSIVAFVNEEPPYFQTEQMGSWVYARRCHERNEKITAMLSLETIGYYSDSPDSQKYPPPFNLLYPSTGNFIGFVGNTSSAALVRQVVGAFRQYEQFPSEGGAPPEAIPGVGFSDQWSFWQEGYPALMVTDTAMFRYPHYHQAEDTPDKIDFERMARVVRGLEKVIAVLAGAGQNADGARP